MTFLADKFACKKLVLQAEMLFGRLARRKPNQPPSLSFEDRNGPVLKLELLVHVFLFVSLVRTSKLV